MSNPDFNMATADQHELRFYAKSIGLELHHSLGVEKMRERILKHVEDQGLEAPVAEININAAEQSWKFRKITINIAKTKEKGGAEPAFVGFQGKGYAIPRGINVDVPAPIVHILQNAMQDIVTQDPETGEIYHEDVLTYSFNIIADPAPGQDDLTNPATLAA